MACVVVKVELPKGAEGIIRHYDASRLLAISAQSRSHSQSHRVAGAGRLFARFTQCGV